MEQAMDDAQPSSATLCPGCNKTVDPLRSSAVSVQGGKIVHFCSPVCRETFLKRAPQPAPSDSPREEMENRPAAEAIPTPESEPEEESPFPHLKLYPSTLVLPQVIQLGILAAVLPVVAFVPGLFEGRLAVMIAAAAVFGIAIWLFVRERRQGFRKIVETVAVPLSAFAVLGASFFDLSPRRAACFAVSLVALETCGRLLELYFRHRSGVLKALDSGDVGIIPSSWRDNSKQAEGARTLAAVMDWLRFPSAVAVSIPVYIASHSPAVTLIAFATALVCLNPRTIRMSAGDAHLSAALRAARKNATIRDADAVYQAACARQVLFVAKHSLFQPKKAVLDWKTSDSYNPKTALDAFATVQSVTQGRIAEAAREFAFENSARAASNVEVTRIFGLGVKGETPWGTVLCGSRRLLLEQGISTGLLESHAQAIEESGRRAVFLAMDEACAAVFAVEDRLAEGAEQAVLETRKLGLDTAMLTSAESVAAQALGNRLGIETVLFETSEEMVGEVLKNAADSGERVLLVGSGPSFEEHFRGADAAIALHPKGGESQAGFNARDNAVTIVPQLIRIAKQAHRSAVTNLVSGIAVSLLGLGLAAAGPSGPTLIALAGLNFLVSAASAANAPFPALENLLSKPSLWIRRRFKKK
jgi:cation transport ATPase